MGRGVWRKRNGRPLSFFLNRTLIKLNLSMAAPSLVVTNHNAHAATAASTTGEGRRRRRQSPSAMSPTRTKLPEPLLFLVSSSRARDRSHFFLKTPLSQRLCPPPWAPLLPWPECVAGDAKLPESPFSLLFLLLARFTKFWEPRYRALPSRDQPWSKPPMICPLELRPAGGFLLCFDILEFGLLGFETWGFGVL